MNLWLESKKNLGVRQTSIPADVIEKFQEKLQNSAGFSSYGEIQLWLKTCFDIDVAYQTVHELVRYKLKAKLKVPYLLHIKQNKQAKENFFKNYYLKYKNRLNLSINIHKINYLFAIGVKTKSELE